MIRIPVGIVALVLLLASGRAPSAEHDGLPARAAAIEARLATETKDEAVAEAAELRNSALHPTSGAADLSEPAEQPRLLLHEGVHEPGVIYDFRISGVPEGVNPKLSFKVNGTADGGRHFRVGSGGKGVYSLPTGDQHVTVVAAWGSVIEGGQVDITLLDDGRMVKVGHGPQPPPDPDVPDPPEPEPTPPVVEGKRTVVLLYELGDQTAEIGRMTVALRKPTGEHDAYLKSNGHTLLILDEEQQDGSGQPLKLVTELRSLGVPLPGLFILDTNTGAVLHKQSLPADAAGVMQVLREHGG